jgi:hypothetical protein
MPANATPAQDGGLDADRRPDMTADVPKPGHPTVFLDDGPVLEDPDED